MWWMKNRTSGAFSGFSVILFHFFETLEQFILFYFFPRRGSMRSSSLSWLCECLHCHLKNITYSSASEVCHDNWWKSTLETAVYCIKVHCWICQCGKCNRVQQSWWENQDLETLPECSVLKWRVWVGENEHKGPLFCCCINETFRMIKITGPLL